MRLSMDENDQGYDPYRAIRATVYLDGVELKDCLTADEEAGECVCFDANSFSIADKPPTIVRRGKVKIVID